MARSIAAARPSLAALVAIALACACGPSEPVKPRRQPSAQDRSPGVPSPAPASASAPPPVPAPAPSEIVVGIDSAITRSGAPNHVRFALDNPGAAAVSLDLRSLALRTDAEPVTLEIQERQLWPEGADEPTILEADAPVVLAAKTKAELLVYLAAWDGDPLAEQYAFEARFAIPGVSDLAVPVTVTRANRDPAR